ncbi:MAG: hypothetical protein K2Z81_26675 [Cyanobacteria bacterium]|nr:hypothetical protein [Cyanobacteriota bacterium]
MMKLQINVLLSIALVTSFLSQCPVNAAINYQKDSSSVAKSAKPIDRAPARRSTMKGTATAGRQPAKEATDSLSKETAHTKTQLATLEVNRDSVHHAIVTPPSEIKSLKAKPSSDVDAFLQGETDNLHGVDLCPRWCL